MLVLSFVAKAQTLPTEKVFFASNRMSYQLGDTIQIDGWLTRCDLFLHEVGIRKQG